MRIGRRDVTLTNLDKVFFPRGGLTKGDLILGVFVDFGQNARDRTIASAYSIRPTPDARASAPLAWDEVPGVDPAAFTLETMRNRVAQVGDPTAGMWRRKVSLASRFEKLGLDPPEREEPRAK